MSDYDNEFRALKNQNRRIIELLETLVVLAGGHLKENAPPPTPEQLKGLVSVVRKRGHGLAHPDLGQEQIHPHEGSRIPPAGGTDPKTVWGRRDRP